MPQNGIKLTAKSELLTNEEVLRLSSFFVQRFGIRKIRLTGGEPLLRPNLTSLIQGLQDLKMNGLETIAITTNALVLKRRLPDLVEAGLDAINISLDTLQAKRFEKMTRRLGWESVMSGIRAAVDCGHFPLVKLNVVVMRDFNEDELIPFVELTRKLPLDIRFIEFMPFTGNGWNFEKMVPFMEMLSIIRSQHPSLARLTSSATDVSKAYKVEGFEGQIGFITSMSS